MFIREKTINGQKYGYLVENNWNKGRIKQQVKEYIGKIIEEGETRTVGGSEFTIHSSRTTDLGHETSNLKLQTWDLILCILRQHLEEKNYKNIRVWEYENEKKTRVNLETGEVTHKGKPAVIKINQGHITKETVNSLRFTDTGHGTRNLKDNSIKTFTTNIIRLGINTTQENILQMYELHVSSTKTKEEKEIKKEFYY